MRKEDLFSADVNTASDLTHVNDLTKTGGQQHGNKPVSGEKLQNKTKVSQSLALAFRQYSPVDLDNIERFPLRVDRFMKLVTEVYLLDDKQNFIELQAQMEADKSQMKGKMK